MAQADAFDGTTLISHETLALARPDHIERAVTSFETDDVRVVITCRDLARQVPAVWQETVKNRSETQYSDFLDQLFVTWRRGPGRPPSFWGAQDVGALVGRWGAAVGAAKVTVVTVPPSGADRAELWRRFRQATDLPEIDYAFPRSDNPSLGVAEAELLRRLNPLLKDTLDWPHYDVLVKRKLAEAVLGPLDPHGKVTLPRTAWDDLAEISAAQVAALEKSGVTVVGDLHDLEPAFDEEVSRQPGDLTDGELLDAALEVIATLATAQTLPEQDAARRGMRPMAGRAMRIVKARIPRGLRDRLRGRR